MATWIRYATADKTATDANVSGTIELTNATAPSDFDPAAVSSVRFQMTCRIVSGTFESGGGEYHTVHHDVALTLNGDAGDVATANAADGILDDGTNGGSTTSMDVTDSTGIPTGYTTAQWEAMELNPGTVANWTTYTKNKGGDGVTVGYQTTNIDVVVTITYTPKANIEQAEWQWYNDGTETGATALDTKNVGGVLPLPSELACGLRILVKNTGASGSVKPKIQYRAKAGAASWSSWADVTTSSAYVRVAPSTFLTDDGTTTQRLGTGTFTAGRIDDGNGAITTAVTVGANQETEFLFSVRLLSGTTDVTLVEWRIVDADTGALYDTYTRYPRAQKPWSWAHGFEGGTDGNDINTSVADPDSWDAVNLDTGELTYDASPVYDGSLSGFVNDSGAGLPPWMEASDQNQGGRLYVRFYVYQDTEPVAGVGNTWFAGLDQGDLASHWVGMDNTSSVYELFIESTNGTYVLSLQTWYRVEIEYVFNSYDNAQDSTITAKIFLGDSLTPLDTVQRTCVDHWWAGMRFGKRFASVGTYHLDAIAMSNEDWIGPLVFPRIPPQRRPLQLVRMKGDRREV